MAQQRAALEIQMNRDIDPVHPANMVRRDRGGRIESSAGSTPKIPDLQLDEATPRKVLRPMIPGYGPPEEHEGEARYMEHVVDAVDGGLRNEVFRLRAENIQLRQRAEQSEVLMQRLQAELYYLRLALESLEQSVTKNAARSRAAPPAAVTAPPPTMIPAFATAVPPTPAPTPAPANNIGVDAAVQAAQAAAEAVQEVVKWSKSMPMQMQQQSPALHAGMGCPVALLPTAMPTPVMGSWLSPFQQVPAAINTKSPEPCTASDPRLQQDMLDMLQRIERLVQTNSFGADALWQRLQQPQPAATTQAPPPPSPLVTINATGTPFQTAHGRSVSQLGTNLGNGSIGSQGLGKLMDELAMVNNRLDSQARSMSVRSLLADKSGCSASDTLGLASPTG